MFEESLRDLRPGYLGDAQVVEQVMRAFLGAVFMANDEYEVISACNETGEVLAGYDKRYTVVPKWAGRDGLNQCLCARLDVDSGLTNLDILRSALGVYAQMALGIVRDGGSDADQEAKVDKLVRYMVALQIGLADVLYPNYRRWHN
jgi:hypothetical protein